MTAPEGKHFVSGRWVSCCEEDETDCPCTCHDTNQPAEEQR